MGYEQTERVFEIANIKGLKCSTQMPYVYDALMRDFTHRLAVVDNWVNEIYSHMMGAVGFTSHLPVVWPEYGLRLWESLEAERYPEALELVKRLRIPYYMFTLKAAAYSGSEGHFDKLAMELVGEIGSPPRPPGRPLPPRLRKEMRQLLIEAGVPGVQ